MKKLHGILFSLIIVSGLFLSFGLYITSNRITHLENIMTIHIIEGRINGVSQ